jgi:prepilin-type N-terminal cleavage/methylation domain-containing protein
MAYGNRGGFSLPELLAVSIIIGVAGTALLRTFSFGTLIVEKEGLRRQALPVVQAELEKIRHISDHGRIYLSPGIRDSNTTLRRMVHTEEIAVPATIQINVTEAAQDNGLRYQNVEVKVFYTHGDITDTIRLASRMYQR